MGSHRSALLLQLHHLCQELTDLLLLPRRVLSLAGQLFRQAGDLLAGCSWWGAPSPSAPGALHPPPPPAHIQNCSTQSIISCCSWSSYRLVSVTMVVAWGRGQGPYEVSRAFPPSITTGCPAAPTSRRSFWFSSSRHRSFCCRASYWKYCCRDSEDSLRRSLGTVGWALNTYSVGRMRPCQHPDPQPWGSPIGPTHGVMGVEVGSFSSVLVV